MADTNEPRPPHYLVDGEEVEEEEEENPPQQQRVIINGDNQPPHPEPIPIVNPDLNSFDLQPLFPESDSEDEDFDDDDDSDDDLLMSDEQEHPDYVSEDDSSSYSEEDDDEDIDPPVISPRVPANSVVGEGGNVAATAAEVEGGEVDGLICPICMGPWTSSGDHQLCCLQCGHLYGLSCIKRWIEHREGSAKCPQCNQKCKAKDVRVLYASRIVVADEESKERVQFLEAKCALLEETIAERSKLDDEMTQEQAAELRRLVEDKYQELTLEFNEMKRIENQRSDDRWQQFSQEQQRQQDQFMLRQQTLFMQQQQQLQQQHAQYMQQQQQQQQHQQQQQQLQQQQQQQHAQFMQQQQAGSSRL